MRMYGPSPSGRREACSMMSCDDTLVHSRIAKKVGSDANSYTPPPSELRSVLKLEPSTVVGRGRVPPSARACARHSIPTSSSSGEDDDGSTGWGAAGRGRTWRGSGQREACVQNLNLWGPRTQRAAGAASATGIVLVFG